MPQITDGDEPEPEPNIVAEVIEPEPSNQLSEQDIFNELNLLKNQNKNGE